MTAPAAVLELAGMERRRGSGEDGFTLEVPAFTVREGQCLALSGPSGSGKSTLLDVLGLVLRPDRAHTFRFTTREGEAIDIAALWRTRRGAALARLRLTEIGYVLQQGGLLPFLRARDNISLQRHLQAQPHDGFVDHLLARLRIAHLAERLPRALSIGERQRVAIARAVAHRPRLVLADEPTASLDPPHAHEVTALLLELAEELGFATIIASHNWELMQSLGVPEVRAAVRRCGAMSITRFEHLGATPNPLAGASAAG